MQRTVLITGGTHGIGAACAQILHQRGCDVIICGRTQHTAQPLLQFISQDVLEPMAAKNIVSQLYKHPHILINNVGGGGRWGKDGILDTDLDVWEQVYKKNTGISIELTRALLPFMCEAGFGRVITISSICSREASGKPWFTVAKAAENALMKILSKDKMLVRNGVTFNTVAPGAIMIPDTGWDTLKKDSPLEYKKLVGEHPMGKFGDPQDVANVVAFLCSEEAGFVNGSYITVDGGESYAI